MNEWLKKLSAQIKDLWSKWTVVQKGILFGIVLVIVVGLVLLLRVSSSPSSVPLISGVNFTDAERDTIMMRLAKENVDASVNAAGVITVKDKSTAQRMRSVLWNEGLIPDRADPWALFDMQSWQTTDFERNVDLRRAVTDAIKKHIESLDVIDNANVVITIPERRTLGSQQEDPTASIVLRPKVGVNLADNRDTVRGIQALVMKCISGLTADNVTISDSNGNILNDFTNQLAADNVNITEREQNVIKKLEAKYRADVLNQLQSIFGDDRVRDLNIKIEMDMSKRFEESTEHTPIVIKADNPDTPYDDSELVESITISSEQVDKVWKGTSYNPEGPAGVEGQNPPVYSDMSNLYGVSEEHGVKKNQVVNEKHVSSEKRPSIDKISVSAAIDGKWIIKYNEDGTPVENTNGTLEREYIPVSASDLESATRLVQSAVGYDRSRGDTVSIVNISYDRTTQFEEEDKAYFRQKQTKTTVFYTVTGLVLLLVIFILYRLISREMERRRRLKEEELMRKHQMEREAALLAAEQAGMEVSMSVEERRRMELQETALTLAKEHPEDVALLIRTWIMEE
ncbi:MAG: flagellar M-ring protein FliF [Treponemataceae bacterium]|nr:flagellar M-ring protein FliF [Treponemataceae bacterium]